MPRKRLHSDANAQDGDNAKAAVVGDGQPSKPVVKAESSPTRSVRATRAAKQAKAESPDPAAVDAGDSTIANGEEKPGPRTPRGGKRNTRGSNKKVKLEDGVKDESDLSDDVDEKPAPTPKSLSATTPSKSTLAKKLKQLEQYLQTPFPDFPYPTAEQCQQVQDSLAGIHGMPKRPTKLEDKPGAAAGCGAVPDVLDALVRTILSQNTTSANSTRAKNAMDAKYGRADYAAVWRVSTEDLAETIACGGLANVKAKVIKKILDQAVTKQMEADPLVKPKDIKHISLDYMHDMSDLDCMKELVSFDGVGPKTASCVLLFCLGRNSFAVDTHVFRITKALGWTPGKANRETAFQHLDVRIPAENKYPLHSLLVRHGRSCRLCSANGNITEEEVDSNNCPIKKYLKDARASASGRSGKKGKQESEVAGMLPKDIKDEEADDE